MFQREKRDSDGNQRRKQNISKNEEHASYEMAHQVSRTTIKKTHINAYYHYISESRIK